MLAVGSTESVVDVAVAEGGQLAGQFLVALGLAGVEADVLEQHHLAALQLFGHSLGLATAEEFLRELHGTAHEGLQVLGHRLEGQLRLEATLLGAAEVGHDDDGGAILQQLLDGGHRLAHAGVVAAELSYLQS